jgi:hypothetical protein
MTTQVAMEANSPGDGRDSGYVRCGAKTRAGTHCGRPSGWGTSHVGFGRCKLHAGSTAKGTTGAARDKVNAEALALLQRLGEPEPLDHPVVELLALGSKAKAWLEVLEEKMAELSDFVSLDNFGAEQARALVRMYSEATVTLHHLLVDLAKLNLEERLVRVTEKQNADLARVLERVLVRAGLDAKAIEVRGWVASVPRLKFVSDIWRGW